MEHDVKNIHAAISNLIEVGVKNLKTEYPFVTTENILTDQLYASFFKSSLRQTLEDLPDVPLNRKNDNPFTFYKSACNLLIGKINKNLSK